MLMDHLSMQEEPLTPDQRSALDRDPALREAMQQWEAVRSGLSGRLEEALPDRRLFVLHALANAGHTADLTEEELAEVQASRDAVAQAVKRYPALEHVSRRIAEDHAEFMACWDEAEVPARIYRLTPLRHVPTVWRIAATVLILVGLATIYARLQQDDLQMIAVGIGDTQQVVLPDGSTVRLIGGSEIHYDMDNFGREVDFQGNAFFDIVRAEEDFVITTEGAITTVHGTRFGIKAADARTEVVLEHGSVSLAAEKFPDRPVFLSPGERSAVEAGMLPDAPEPVNLTTELDWTGYLFLNATPMAEVVRILSERYDLEIVVDESLQSEQVSGLFKPDDTPDYILSVLVTVLDATLEGDQATGFTIR